jgi:hypothetical protein
MKGEATPGLVRPGELEAHALWFTAPRSAEFRPERVPPPEAGEVRVRAIASALSQGTEMLVYRGEVPTDLPLDLPTLAGSFGFPIKYGYATVGRVLDTGASVEDLVPGDLVFVHHPHQDVFVVPVSMPVRLSDELDPVLGLFVANLETAVNIVHDTPLRLGETALVFGQGVVGLLVAQLLRLVGAGRVLAVDPLKKRRDLARAVGGGCSAGRYRSCRGRGHDRRGVVVRREARNPLTRGTFSPREGAAQIFTGRTYEPGSRSALGFCPADGDGARSAAPTTLEGTYLPLLPFRRGAGGVPACGRTPRRGGTGNPHPR